MVWQEYRQGTCQFKQKYIYTKPLLQVFWQWKRWKYFLFIYERKSMKVKVKSNVQEVAVNFKI